MSQKRKIMEKVAKLLELANGTSHTEESKSAFNMAASLMAKHHIKAIELNNNEEFIKGVKFMDGSRVQHEHADLHHVLADYCGVALIIRRRPRKNDTQHLFIGKESDVDALFYLIDIVEGQRDRYLLKRIKEQHQTAKGKRTILNSYAFGVKEKLAELKRMENSKVQEYGLVPVDLAKQALAHYKRDNNVKSGGTRRVSIDNDALQAGRNASLHQGVTSQDAIRRIA